MFWGGTGGKEHLSAKMENEPFCPLIGGKYFTRATESVHCLGRFFFRQDLGFILFYPSKEKAPGNPHQPTPGIRTLRDHSRS